MPMKIKNKRFDFTKKNKKTGEIKKVGYLDLKEDEDEKISLYFYGDICSSTWESYWDDDATCPQDIADFLNQIEKDADVEVHFNSGGGDVFAGIAIYNQLKRHAGNKVGYVDGLAASIASVIMFACDELHFSTGSQAMVHKPSCIAWGNADDMQKVIEQLDKCEDSILDVYMDHVNDGITREEIKEMVDSETWLNGSEIAEYFDVIVDDSIQDVAACASSYFERYKNLPENLDKRKNNNIDVVDAVLAALDERDKKQKKQREQEMKDSIMCDLFMYGI